ncbi:hypothetical protein BD779DRAFT_1477079 [Infundibulicybe gibba]|nr:hypothetical protein BD779DRAFT_1477079 [Infundibulicybe gibba]
MTANRAPTNSEVAYSREVISSSERMILLIQTTVGDLEKRKAELLGLISTHKAAISPLRSFPPEILAEIFVQFVSMVQVGRWRFERSPPLMLMGICSRWRWIVLDTPRLWTKILTPHSMIDSWINRSKELPLHLELELSWFTSDPALKALIPHSHRWEHVDFHLEPDSISVLAPVRSRLHSLKRLNLHFGNSNITGTVDFCEVAPQLTEIGLTGIRNPEVTIKLPWEQLRACTLDGSGITHYVLQHAKNLRGLHLDMSNLGMMARPWLELPGTSPHSDHLVLKVLIVEWSFDSDAEMDQFFSSITLPSLRTLKVRFNYPEPDDAEHAAAVDADRAELAFVLADFFKRSCTHLTTLELTGIPFSQSALIKCLVFSPSLVSLDIRFDSQWNTINEKLLRRLNVNHPKYILPCLRSLAIRGAVGLGIEAPLDALIASRRHIDPKHHKVAMLENLILSECSFFQIDGDYPWFQRFAPEGLNITRIWYTNSTQVDNSVSRISRALEAQI